jgi:hypothetical protein
VAENDSWRQIVRRAWAEPDFKQRLLTNPHEVLAEYNINIPDGVTYQVVEDHHAGTRHLVLPPPPDPNDPDLRVDDFGRDVESGDPGF